MSLHAFQKLIMISHDTRTHTQAHTHTHTHMTPPAPPRAPPPTFRRCLEIWPSARSPKVVQNGPPAALKNHGFWSRPAPRVSKTIPNGALHGLQNRPQMVTGSSKIDSLDPGSSSRILYQESTTSHPRRRSRHDPNSKKGWAA